MPKYSGEGNCDLKLFTKSFYKQPTPSARAVQGGPRYGGYPKGRFGL